MLRLFCADRESVVPPAVLTVGDVIALYLEHAPHRQTSQVVDDRRRVITKFARVHGSLSVDEARPFHLRKWVEKQRKWQSGWTRRRGAGHVKMVFGWAIQERLIDRNPFAGCTFPRGKRGRAIKPAEFQSLLRTTTAIFRRVLIFLRFSGARPGELSVARWTDIDMERCCLVLDEHKTDEDGEPRTVILHPVLLKLLAWIQVHKPHPEFIFVNAKGRPWCKDSLCHRVAKLREKCGVAPDVKLYCLRHGYAIQAVAKNIDIAVLAQLMGHKDISMTAYYARIAGKTDLLQKAVAKMFASSTALRS